MLEYSHVVGTAAENDWVQLELIANLLSSGLVVIRGVPREEGQCVKLAELLSTLRKTEWGETFDVKYMMEESSSSAEKAQKQDLAYTGKGIGMHTDNPYRYPTPDFQLLHAIEHCSCDTSAPSYTSTHNCDECRTTNYRSIHFHVPGNKHPKSLTDVKTGPKYYYNTTSVPVPLVPVVKYSEIATMW